MSEKYTEDERAYNTLLRKRTEDGVELLLTTLDQWKAQGRLAPDVDPVIAKLSLTGITALLTKGLTFIIPLGDPSRAQLS